MPCMDRVQGAGVQEKPKEAFCTFSLLHLVTPLAYKLSGKVSAYGFWALDMAWGNAEVQHAVGRAVPMGSFRAMLLPPFKPAREGESKGVFGPWSPQRGIGFELEEGD